MFARVTTFAGPDADIDAELRTAQATSLPWLRDQIGYRGSSRSAQAARMELQSITTYEVLSLEPGRLHDVSPGAP